MAKSDEIRRREWLRDFTRYQRIGRRIFGAGIRKAVDNIPIDNITERNYREAVDLNVPEEPIFDAFVRFYFEVGADAGDRTFSELLEAVNAPKQKQFANPVFAEKYRRELIAWARKNLYTKITSVRGDVVSEIIKLIEFAMLEEKSIVEIRQMLKKAFASRNFYNWQIDRITRTETTAAANHGSVYGGTTTGIPLYKRWISLPDSRTRRRGRDAFDHVQMNGKTVGHGEMFEIRGFVKGVPVVDFIEYPGDPRGSAGNVINCRCRVVLIPKRDANGRIRYSDPRFNGGGTPRPPAPRPPAQPPRPPAPKPRPKPPAEPANPATWQPAKNMTELEERLRKIAPSVNFQGLPMKHANELLEGIERVFNKFPHQLERRIGFQQKRMQSLGVYWHRRNPLPNQKPGLAIEFQSSFVRNPNKDGGFSAERYLARRDMRIGQLKRRLEQDRPESLHALTREEIAKLENAQRWGVMEEGRPIFTTAVHESYHSVYYNFRLQEAFKKLLEYNGVKPIDWYKVSEYGASSIQELWAETGAAIELGVPIPAAIRRAFEETLKTIVL